MLRRQHLSIVYSGSVSMITLNVIDHTSVRRIERIAHALSCAKAATKRTITATEHVGRIKSLVIWTESKDIPMKRKESNGYLYILLSLLAGVKVFPFRLFFLGYI